MFKDDAVFPTLTFHKVM